MERKFATSINIDEIVDMNSRVWWIFIIS